MDFPEFHRKYASSWAHESEPPRRPGGLPRQGKVVFKTFSAHMIVSGKLKGTIIFEKPNQNFYAYATDFEKDFSKLASSKNALQAVVDTDLTVIGHTGVVHCSSILIPKVKASHEMGKTYDLPAKLVNEGVPVFVGSEPPDDNWVRYMTHRDPCEISVVTGIDGRVIAATKARLTEKGVESEAFSPLDLILIIKGIAELGVAVGHALVRGLARKSTASAAAKVIVFAGPTEELALSAAKEAAPLAVKRTAKYVPESGMTTKHFAVFQEAAKDVNAIVIVRNGKQSAIKLIDAGCPGKPMYFKFGTSESTGVLTAATREEIALAWSKEYYVVGADGVARREVVRQGKRITETLDTKNAFWKLEKGQVIDPVLKKPVVGDYDLMGVIDPSAPGRNITLAATKKGGTVADTTSPLVTKVAQKVNSKLDRPRVLHGAQDQYLKAEGSGFRGGATAFHPDGTVTYLPDQAAVEVFYKSIGRATIKGKYPSAPSAVDELAARRAAKGLATAGK